MITAARFRKSVLFFLLVTGTTQVCWAHAILIDSSPKANSAVPGSDLVINLRFNVRIDGARSRVMLVTPNGRTSTLALGNQSTPNTLRSHVAGLKPGAYKLEWQVLASDGHMSSGEIPFTVN